MKNCKLLKKVTVMMLLFAFLLVPIIPVSAVEFTDDRTEMCIDTKAIYATKHVSKEAYMSSIKNDETCTIQDSISVEQLSMSGTAEKFRLSFILESQVQIFEGTLYPVVGGGYYDGKLVLGDFTSNNNYNIACFRVDKKLVENADSNNVVYIVAEDLLKGYIIEIKWAIDDNEFSLLQKNASEYYESLQIVPASSEYYDVVEKTISLMQINNNWRMTEYSTSTSRALSSFSYNSVSTSNSGISVAENVLQTFFSNMNTYGDTTGKYYASTSTIYRMLNQDGWKVYYNSSATTPYFYALYGVDNGSTRLAQIIYCSISSAHTSNSNAIDAHWSVVDSLLVELDNTNTCRVVYYAGGPQLTNAYLCISELEGARAIFTSSYITFHLYNNGYPMAKLLISKTKVGQAVLDVWSVLSYYVNINAGSSWGAGFPVTVDAQLADGGLIKNICAQSGSAMLVTDDDYLHLKGYVSGTYISHEVEIKFTAKRMI